MARARSSDNGHSRLEEAMALLINNQAAFVARMAEADQRFARIEALLADHSRVLGEHSRILAEHSQAFAEMTHLLQGLPEVIRDKIGFKPP